MMTSKLENLRELGAQQWQPVVTIVAAALGTMKYLWDYEKGSVSVRTFAVFGVCLLVLISVRSQRVGTGLTRWILGPPPRIVDPPRIFRGLLPYRAEEILPGRRADADGCWIAIQQYSFLIIESESGCGKTSLLAVLGPVARDRKSV